MKILWIGLTVTLIALCSGCRNGHEVENNEPMKIDLSNIESIEMTPTMDYSMDDAPIMDKKLEE